MLPSTKALTPAQQNKIREYHEKWERIGRSILPTNRPRAEAAIRELYKKSKPFIVWCGSPMSMCKTYAWIKNYRPDIHYGNVTPRDDHAGFQRLVVPWDEELPRELKRDIEEGTSHCLDLCGFNAPIADFTANELGLDHKSAKEIMPYIDLAMSAYTILCYRHVIFACENFLEMHMDEDGRFHNENGPAILFPDGWSVWAIHGKKAERPK